MLISWAEPGVSSHPLSISTPLHQQWRHRIATSRCSSQSMSWLLHLALRGYQYNGLEDSYFLSLDKVVGLAHLPRTKAPSICKRISSHTLVTTGLPRLLKKKAECGYTIVRECMVVALLPIAAHGFGVRSTSQRTSL